MSVLTLSLYSLKRLVRNKPLWAVLLALPLLAALVRSIFPDSSVALGCTWACPFVCVLLACATIYAQYMVDSTSGMRDGLRSTPLTDSMLIVSRIISGALVFAIQMLLFGAILAVRF